MMSRDEIIKEIKWYCEELNMKLPERFPDKMTDKEMQDFIWCWSEYDPCPDLK